MISMPPEPEPQEGDEEAPDRGLTPKQEQAIIALLNNPTVGKAALQIGISERTLYRWLDQPEFGQAFRRARRETHVHAISLTQHFAPHAVNTLAKVMSDPSAPHSARVSAATTMLKFSREGIELDDLAARMESLEQAIAATRRRRD